MVVTIIAGIAFFLYILYYFCPGLNPSKEINKPKKDPKRRYPDFEIDGGYALEKGTSPNSPEDNE